MKDLESVNGVIFDVDGTLVDSNEYHAKAFDEAFREFGHNVDMRTIRPLIGMGGEKLIPRALGRPCTEKEIEAIGDCKSRLFMKKHLPYVRAFPKVVELVQWLKSWNLGLAVATSAGKEELAALMKVAAVEKYFDGITTADDAEESKPAPDIVKAAIAKLGEDEDRLVMIGDTPYDIEAATRAGIRCIGVRSGGWSDTSLTGASAIYDGVWDLYDTIEKVDATTLAPPVRAAGEKRVAFGGFF